MQNPLADVMVIKRYLDMSDTNWGPKKHWQV